MRTPTAYVDPAPVAGRVVLGDVTVVDPAAGVHLPHRDIVVEGERIVGVEPAGAGRGPRVDASGRFVVPGYVDAHVHVLNHPEAAASSFALMLAHGITGYRQMSGNDALLGGRDALPRPPGAPRLLALCGDLLTPLNAATPEQARATVRRQHARGADFVKAAMAPRDAFLAAADEGARLGVPLAGHLPADVSAADVAAHRVGCVEHLGPGAPLFVDASTCCPPADPRRRPAPDVPAWARPAAGAIANRLLERLVINPAQLTSRAAAATLTRADDTYDPQAAATTAHTLRDAGVWQCPTLIRLHTSQTPGSFAADRRLTYVDPAVRAAWDASLRRYLRRPAAVRDALARHLDAQTRLLAVFAGHGVPLLAGTDANGAGWVVPGFALHDEFALLAAAGLTPAAVLRSATTAPAAFLGRATAGRVAAGADADLVVLGADPLDSVAALGAIDGVMRGGHYWPRDHLDRILDRCAAHPTAR